MKIEQTVWNSISEQVASVSTETGGILGGLNQIITTFHIDSGRYSDKDTYRPDVKNWNQVLWQWQKSGIEFYGIFHSHIAGIIKLSNSDRAYIFQIMQAAPKSVESLYFPIILPKKSIQVYRAMRCEGEIRIVCDEIEIIEGGDSYGNCKI